MTVHCRPAGPDDVKGIAAVRIRSWQEGYRGIMPQPYLDALSVDAEVGRWEARAATPGFLDGQSVAVLDGEVVGWSAVGAYRDADDPEPAPGPRCGELNAIYVLPRQWGGGVGRALLAHALERLGADDRSPVLLWVLRDNARARRFYERSGWHPDGLTQTYEAGGATLPEVRYRLGS